MRRLDSLDFEILEALKDPGAVTPNATYIASKLKKPVATIHGRLKRLESRRIIEKYGSIISHKEIGSEITGFLLLKVPPGKSIENYAKQLSKRKEIAEVNLLVGQWSFLCKIRATGMEDYARIVEIIFEEMKPSQMEDINSPKTHKREL